MPEFKHLENENKIVLEPGKYPTLKENLLARNIDYDKFMQDMKNRSTNLQSSTVFNPPGSKWSDYSVISKDIKDASNQLNTLLKNQDPTKIQFWGTILGSFLVNPSVVSPATLQRIAENEIVSKSLSLNASKIINSIGDWYHTDKEKQEFVRFNIENSKSTIKEHIERMLSADIFGHSVCYIRDYVDKDGYTRIDDIDLLPHSTILYSADARGNLSNAYQYVYSYPLANTQNLLTVPFFGSGDSSNLYSATPDLDGLASYGDLINPYRTTIINTFGLIRLDMNKVIHYTPDDIIKTANPYGWSPICRRAFDLVLLYDLFKDLYTSFLGNRAVPIIVGYADNNAIVDRPDGTTITAIEGLYEVFSNTNKFGAYLLSGLKDQIYTIDVIQSTGDNKAFYEGLEWARKQIQQTMGLPNDLLEADSSYAGATAQNSIYSESLSGKRVKLENVYKKTYIKYLLQSNFADFNGNLGNFESELNNLDDKGKYMSFVTQGIESKLIAPTMKLYHNIISKAVGLPVLDDKQYKEYMDHIEKYNEQMIDAKQKKDNKGRVDIKGSGDHYTHAKKN